MRDVGNKTAAMPPLGVVFCADTIEMGPVKTLLLPIETLWI
jgi:hypothetical protein